MSVKEYYLSLCKELNHGSGLPIPITLEKISSIFICSQRNANLLLRKLEKQELIMWKAGRGRGNHSTISLLQSADSIAHALAQEFIEKGEVKKAFQVIEDFATEETKESFFRQFLGDNSKNAKNAKNEPSHSERPVEELVVDMGEPLDTIDPAYVIHSNEYHVVKQLFDTLLVYHSETNQLLPHLAYHWEVDETNTVYTFFLRKRVMFHHGRELTAEDVVFSLMRLQDETVKSPYRFMFKDIREIRVDSPMSIKIVLNKPNYLFISFLSNVQTSILPKDVYHTADHKLATPIGTGPFQAHSITNDNLVMHAFDPYFKGRSIVDRIVMTCTTEPEPDTNTKAQPPTISYYENNPEPSFSPIMFHQLLYCNVDKPGPLRHHGIRKAVSAAIHRTKYIEVLGNQNSFYSENIFVKHTERKEDPFDPDCVQRLLNAEGMERISLRLMTRPFREKEAYWLQTEWKKYGIDLEVQFAPITSMAEAVHFNKADLILSGRVIEDNDDFAFLEMVIAENSFLRRSAGPQFRALIDQRYELLTAEQSEAGRKKHLLALEQLIKEQHILIFLYQTPQSVSHGLGVRGITLDSLGWVQYKDVWVTNEQS